MSEITSKFYKDQIKELIKIVKDNQNKIKILEEKVLKLELEKNNNIKLIIKKIFFLLIISS